MITHHWLFITAVLFLTAPIWGPVVMAVWHWLVSALESIHE